MEDLKLRRGSTLSECAMEIMTSKSKVSRI